MNGGNARSEKKLENNQSKEGSWKQKNYKVIYS